MWMTVLNLLNGIMQMNLSRLKNQVHYVDRDTYELHVLCKSLHTQTLIKKRPNVVPSNRIMCSNSPMLADNLMKAEAHT